MPSHHRPYSTAHLLCLHGQTLDVSRLHFDDGSHLTTRVTIEVRDDAGFGSVQLRWRLPAFRFPAEETRRLTENEADQLAAAWREWKRSVAPQPRGLTLAYA
ncbi:hypothetical protein K0B96_03465 [Horticoccus luteus]|uniref:Uncharacterized protein n=1 Tax=Horticoccus luteus TaxID=2862869 RepID=A0A8F9XLY2_9BACT|nr:hypothetical protein [Horticoccus luteus]QYM79691.1 hypothetical protein K0B96_03465 [Horticoccus luteus]